MQNKFRFIFISKVLAFVLLKSNPIIREFLFFVYLCMLKQGNDMDEQQITTVMERQEWSDDQMVLRAEGLVKRYGKLYDDRSHRAQCRTHLSQRP